LPPVGLSGLEEHRRQDRRRYGAPVSPRAGRRGCGGGAVRIRLGLLPHTKVEFELAGDHARIRKARRQPGEDARGRLVLEALRGSADTRMSTDEILALTRSEPRRAKRRRV
jgi:hypothetical protein